MKLTLGFSPCPNDTFMFDAMVHHKVDTEGLQFEMVMDDVETLNQRAFNGELDVSKLSYHAFAYVTDKYLLLTSGSALGFGVGPLLISVGDYRLQADGFQNEKIAIPGKYTTANFLFSLAFPHAKNKSTMLFSEIENAVLNGEVDLGVIIHENRFTYEQKGLKKVMDLGGYWEKLTGCAIPLGGIVVNRSLPEDIQKKVNHVLRRSIEYAFANPLSGMGFVREHSQEMSDEVMQKHINLYVNDYSVDLGTEGKRTVETMFAFGKEKGIIPEVKQGIFIADR